MGKKIYKAGMASDDLSNEASHSTKDVDGQAENIYNNIKSHSIDDVDYIEEHYLLDLASNPNNIIGQEGRSNRIMAGISIGDELDKKSVHIEGDDGLDDMSDNSFDLQEEEYDDELEDEAYRLERKRSRKKFLLLTLSGLLVIILVASLSLYYLKSEYDGKYTTAPSEVRFVVVPGTTAKSISEDLRSAGLIGNETAFFYYSRLSGASAAFQQGTFNLEPNMTYSEITGILTTTPKNQDNEQTMVVPPGTTAMAIAKIAADRGFCTEDDFLNELKNGDFSEVELLSEINYDPDTFFKLEGYLAPDTYTFVKGKDTAHDIIVKLLKQTEAELKEDIINRMQERGLDIRQTFTLASLIEEEASSTSAEPTEDQKKVASVFWNRMQPNSPQKRMGSDVTYYYLRDWMSHEYNYEIDEIPRNLFYAYYTGDEDEKSRVGLPAGPISSPGLAAIKAALWPDDTDYYFFVTDQTGKYYYAKTYDEHLKNVAQTKEVNNSIKSGETQNYLEDIIGSNVESTS